MDSVNNKSVAARTDDVLDRRLRMRFIMALVPLFLAFILWAAREVAWPYLRMRLMRSGQLTFVEILLAYPGFVPLTLAIGATLSFAIFSMTYLETGFRPFSAGRFRQSNESQPQENYSLHNDGYLADAPRIIRVIGPPSPVTIHDSIERLQRELAALTYRGNLSLVLGSTTTVSGILMFGYFVFFKQPPIDPTHGNPWWYIAEFLPRASLVVIIEVFAFFFLRLYKAGLADVKYFQNELTNVEARAIALQSAKESGDKITEASVIIKLAETERNFVLRKGEVTPDMKREEMERTNTASMLKEISSIVRAGIPHANARDTKAGE